MSTYTPSIITLVPRIQLMHGAETYSEAIGLYVLRWSVREENSTKSWIDELPKTPKVVMDSWMPKLQAVAVVTALFAGVEAQLIGGIPDPGDHPSAADTVLRYFAYTGLLLNLGATLSAILLLVAVASLPTAARQIYVSCKHGYPRKVFENNTAHVAELNNHLLHGQGETYILHAFGIARGWNLMLRHCIFCFLGGSVCAFLHIGINLWISESILVAAIVMPSAVFGFVPPLVLYMFYMGSPLCQECSEELSMANFKV